MKTVSIGIAAYNSEKNIIRLISTILNQKERTYLLEKIYVHSDASKDNTVKVINSLKNPNIRVIDSKIRKGFAGSIRTLLKGNASDIFILLNDDVLIKDTDFIEKAILPFNDDKVGLSSVNLIPLPSENFIENAVKTGYLAYSNFAKSHKQGDNILTCDGKVLMLSKQFVKQISLPKNLNEVGNLDTYLFIVCKLKKFHYKYSNLANVYFRPPSNIADFIKWQKRNYKNKILIANKFPSISAKEYDLPKFHILYFKFVELLKNPLGSILIAILGIFCSLITTIDKSEFNSRWDLVYSTKVIKSKFSN